MEKEPKLPVDPNQHLRTDDLRANLKGRSLRSGLITFIAQPVNLAIGIGSTAVLARLLTPADFGLLAMVTPVLLLVDSLSNLGLETATIHRENLDHQQLSAVFWLSLAINAVVFGLMLLIAPVLAWFYRQPQLTGMTLMLAMGFLSQCLAFQHRSLLKRQMRFGTLTAVDMTALIVSNGSAIASAWLGWSYWALVLQLVVMQFTQSLGCWLVCGWQPAKYSPNLLTPDVNLRAMFSYGVHLTAFRVLTRVSKRLDRILIGYFSGARALGFYDVAYRWAYFSFEMVYMPLFDVAVSSFSRVQHDSDLYRAYCRRGLMPIFALCMPALAFCFVEAPETILLLLGKQWLEAVPIFQLLTIAVFFNSMDRVTKWLYVSEGQTQRQFYWSLISTPVMMTALIVGSRWGAYGVAMGYTVATCLLAYPSVAYCLKTSPVNMSDFLSAVGSPVLASLAAAVVLFVTRFALPNTGSLIINLMIKLIVFGITYLLIWFFLPSGRKTKVELLLNLKQLSTKGKS